MLSVNSEEFSVSDDYERMLEQILPTCKSEKHLLSVAGTTHPSFSDVFLIIPGPSELKRPPRVLRSQQSPGGQASSSRRIRSSSKPWR